MWYRTTENGGIFALASGAPPIWRATAERVVAQFVDRVRRANASDYYLYRVSRVVVFGSYLTDAPKLNDVDIAIELQPRIQDKDEHTKRVWERIGESNRDFRNVFEKVTWPEHELLLYLKARSRALSLHMTSDRVLEVTAQREIYPSVRNVPPCKSAVVSP